MAVVTAGEMRALEEAAFRAGWTEERLMDLAGERLAHALAAHFPKPGRAIACIGKGHNGGDALVALRLLRDRFGWEVGLRAAFSPEEVAPLTGKKWSQAGAVELLHEPPSVPDSSRPLVLLDGLLGIGARGPLREPLAAMAAEMNRLRETAGAKTAAVDLPSGTDPDTGEIHRGGVIADVTFMIGAAKRGLVTAAAANAVGALAVVPVEPLATGSSGAIELISPQTCSFGKTPRRFDFHKGMAGRVDIVAGSACYSGAAAITAWGALRGGAGLVMLHSPAWREVSAKAPAEAIVLPCDNPADLLEKNYDVIAIGPGLGQIDGRLADDIAELIAEADVPLVIDADGLNLLARGGNLGLLRDSHVITPHPGEFRRLAPDLADLPREESARRFAALHPAALLLKGSRTLVIQGEGTLWCNSTGHPGMACGGQGDLLTGVIAARLAAGLPGVEAAAHGAWLCGRAAERAITASESEESLLPRDVADHLGAAFTDWREGRR